MWNMLENVFSKLEWNITRDGGKKFNNLRAPPGA